MMGKALRKSLFALKNGPICHVSGKDNKRPNFLDTLWCANRKHDSERHIFDPNKLKIPRVIIDMQVTESPSSRIGHMIGNRALEHRHTSNRPVAPENLGPYLHRTERNRRPRSRSRRAFDADRAPLLRKRQTRTQASCKSAAFPPSPRLKPTPAVVRPSPALLSVRDSVKMSFEAQIPTVRSRTIGSIRF